MTWLLLLAAVAPVAFMLHYVYTRDRYEKEPIGRIAVVFFASFLTVIPAAIAESLLMGGEPVGLLAIAVTCFLVIALSEEFFKYLAVKWLAVRHPSFNEVYDGILYAVVASLGFACVENILYVFMSAAESTGEGFVVAVLRAFLAVPGHALWGVMMGYYIGLAKFEPDKGKKRGLVLRGVVTAIFWHGLYDFFAFGAEATEGWLLGFMGLGVVAVIIVNWVIANRMIKDAQRRSSFRQRLPLVDPVITAAERNYKYCHKCGFRQPRENSKCTSCGYEFPR